ncbi:uncharacterized protein LOC117341062 isoform X2 [Pecten maximus]|uniref:uncharacterized protein LOC117341062 isoform X2 n=1 Tax=Pecten maximus TaxID=6579 RepID=UPI001458970F|nr:uncharacterized protein LOC117341062 isoform X2 [Pecten maximus]
MAASVWLPKYAKSVEEETLKWLLKIFLQQERKFVNLVIEGCNAKRACCFTDAFVELEAYQKNRSCEEPVSKRNGVLVTDMVDTDILEQFILSGVEAVPNIEPFRAILDFIHDRRRHELAIRKIMEKTGGSGLAVALSEHLFSQLLASKDYRIDCSSKHLLKKCACGCNADIKSGTTALGSPFHMAWQS